MDYIAAPPCFILQFFVLNLQLDHFRGILLPLLLQHLELVFEFVNLVVVLICFGPQLFPLICQFRVLLDFSRVVLLDVF